MTESYFSFRVDSALTSVKFITVLSTKQDARTDAVSAVHAELGKSARVISDAASVYAPDPVCDIPSKKCVSNGVCWAWIGTAG